MDEKSATGEGFRWRFQGFWKQNAGACQLCGRSCALSREENARETVFSRQSAPAAAGRFVAAPFSALMALWRTLIVEPSVTSVVASANPAGLNERHVLPHACCPCAVYALPGAKPSKQFPPWDARIQPIRHCATHAGSLPDAHLGILPAQAVAGVPPCTCRAFFHLCHASARLYAMGVPSLLNRGSFSR